MSRPDFKQIYLDTADTATKIAQEIRAGAKFGVEQFTSVGGGFVVPCCSFGHTICRTPSLLEYLGKCRNDNDGWHEPLAELFGNFQIEKIYGCNDRLFKNVDDGGDRNLTPEDLAVKYDLFAVACKQQAENETAWPK